MRYTCIAALLVMGLAAMAQPDPDQPIAPVDPPRPRPVTTITSRESTITATPHGLFILSRGVLAKYDAKTLAPKGVLVLIDVPAQPPAIARPVKPGDPRPDNAAYQQWLAARRAATAVPEVIVTETDLLIVQDDRFFRVSQEMFAVEAKAVFGDAGGARIATYGGGAAPLVTLAETTLYVVQGTAVWSVDTVDGKLLGKADLPKEMLQQPGGLPNPIVRPLPDPILLDMPAMGAPIALDPPAIMDWMHAFINPKVAQ